MANKKTTPCECGCGGATIRPEARFLPGHDARLKSALIRTALAGGAGAKAAEAKIRSLGWELHLAISRAKAEKLAEQAKRTAAAKASGRKPAAPAKPARVRKPVANPAGSDGSVPESVGTLAGSAAS
jgi:hypothetical protein